MKRFYKTGAAATILALLFFIPSYVPEGIFGHKEDPHFSFLAEALADKHKQTSSPVAESRKIVQASSRRIAELVVQRPTPNPYFNPLTLRETADQERIDFKIEAIHRNRLGALVEVVLAENPGIQKMDPEEGIYRVPIVDVQGRTRWLSGSLLPIWHLQQFNPSVFGLAEAIRSYPASAALPSGTQVTCHLWLGGTSSQSAVHPYPNDIDFAEQFIIKAQDKNAAGKAAAATMIEFVARTSKNPNLEFLRLRVMPLAKEREERSDYRWPLARILDPSQKPELARQLTRTDSGRLNSDWRALVSGGRFVKVGKYFSIHALNRSTGQPLFTTQLIGTEYQQAFFGTETPPLIQRQKLGAYASLMRQLALKEAKKEKYLKATKRAFNYFRAIGDLEAMAELAKIFSGPEARIIQQSAILGAISTALDPATPSRILTATVARDQLLRTTLVIKADLSRISGSSPGHRLKVAGMMYAIAADIRERQSDPVGIVEPDAALVERMDTLMEEALRPVVRASLKARVDTIFADHLK